MTTDLQDADWLVANANQLLDGIRWPVDILQFVTQLRKHHSASRSHMLCELLELRDRAQAKFSRANQMYFNRVGYEQATDELLAHYKAQRYVDEEHVIDLCCGIGGDTIALADACQNATFLDRSAASLGYATANLQAHGLENVRALLEAVEATDLSPYSAWHIDPDRRGGTKDGRRISNPVFCEPSLQDILELSGRGPNGAIKMAPAADASALLEHGVELEWMGHGRECQQQVAWFGAFARHPGRRTASWFSNQDSQWHTLVETDCPPARSQSESDQFLYEPCPSVLAAGLIDTLAETLELEKLSTTAYLTGGKLVVSPLLSPFRVIDDKPFHRSTLLKTLQVQNCRVEAIKKRGVPIDPNALLREMPSEGENAVALLLYPQDQSIRCAVAIRE